MEPDRSTITFLQAGRGAAAVAVVIHHSALAADDFGEKLPITSAFEYGYLGVDFFFVLSGFIIYHSTVGRQRLLSDYIISRLRRVFVPYLPVGLGIATLYTLLPNVSSGTHSWGWLPTLTLLPVNQSPALSVAWTLQHEMLFYGLFALLYFGRQLWLGLSMWALAILVATPTAIPLQLINLEFLFGIAAAWAYRRNYGHWSLWLLACVPFILWIALGAERELSVLVGGSCALVVLELARLERQGRCAPRWSVFLGAASYAIYLVHGLAISVIARVVPSDPLFILSAGIAVGTLAGVVYHLLVERPLIQILSAPKQRSLGDRTGVLTAQTVGSD